MFDATFGKMGTLCLKRLQRTERSEYTFWTTGYLLSDRGHAKDVTFLGELFSASYHLRFVPRA